MKICTRYSSYEVQVCSKLYSVFCFLSFFSAHDIFPSFKILFIPIYQQQSLTFSILFLISESFATVKEACKSLLYFVSMIIVILYPCFGDNEKEMIRSGETAHPQSAGRGPKLDLQHRCKRPSMVVHGKQSRKIPEPLQSVSLSREPQVPVRSLAS